MMYKWLDAKVHDVKTFNKIFNLSKLQGFDQEEEVEVGLILVGGLREVTVRDNTQLLELKSANMNILIEAKTDKPILNRNEQLIVDYLMVNGESGYTELKESLNFTRNVMSKTSVSLVVKDVISQTGHNKTHSPNACKIKLLMPELSKKNPKFQNPVFNNPVYKLNPSSFKVLTFIKEIAKENPEDYQLICIDDKEEIQPQTSQEIREVKTTNGNKK